MRNPFTEKQNNPSSVFSQFLNAPQSFPSSALPRKFPINEDCVSESKTVTLHPVKQNNV